MESISAKDLDYISYPMFFFTQSNCVHMTWGDGINVTKCFSFIFNEMRKKTLKGCMVHATRWMWVKYKRHIGVQHS